MIHYMRTPDGRVVTTTETEAWARWFESADRSIAKDEVGEARVSTVFIGVDHNFDNGPPILWETMIFGGEFDQHQWRYPTEAAAKAGHNRIVAALRAGENPEELRCECVGCECDAR